MRTVPGWWGCGHVPSGTPGGHRGADGARGLVWLFGLLRPPGPRSGLRFEAVHGRWSGSAVHAARAGGSLSSPGGRASTAVHRLWSGGQVQGVTTHRTGRLGCVPGPLMPPHGGQPEGSTSWSGRGAVRRPGRGSGTARSGLDGPGRVGGPVGPSRSVRCCAGHGHRVTFGRSRSRSPGWIARGFSLSRADPGDRLGSVVGGAPVVGTRQRARSGSQLLRERRHGRRADRSAARTAHRPRRRPRGCTRPLRARGRGPYCQTCGRPWAWSGRLSRYNANFIVRFRNREGWKPALTCKDTW
jgi:hypothetical protein